MRVTPVYGLHLFCNKFIWDLFGLLACLIVNDNKGNRKNRYTNEEKITEKEILF